MPRTITAPQLDPAERKELTPAEMDEQEWKRRCAQACLFVATFAEDTDDCHMLLDMLGLLGDDTQPYRGDALPPDCSPHVGGKWR